MDIRKLCGPLLPGEKRRIMLTAPAVVCAGGLILYFALFPIVRKNVCAEAGAPLPDVSEFIISGGKKTAAFLAAAPYDTSVPGDHPVTVCIVTAKEKYYASTLTVRDTIPPAAVPVPVVAWAGEKLLPGDFVSDVYDATLVDISFAEEPDTRITGTRPVDILLTDAGGNTTRISSELRVFKAADKLELKPGADKSLLTALSFVENAAKGDAGLFTLDTDLDKIDFSVPGKRRVAVSLAGKKHWCVLDILDTTPPAASPRHLHLFIGDSPDPKEFVKDIVDETSVTVTFVSVPDNTLEGEQPVTLLLTDAYGNTAEVVSALTLIPDTEPPLIYGMLDKTIFAGDTIAYRADITVTDNRDKEVLLKIDSGAVDTKTEGKYPVLYSATDQSGNTAQAQGTVTVLSVSREQAYEMADKVLAAITDDGMGLYDKAQAIYKWVRANIAYINTSIKDDTTIAAYRGLRDKRGDCFVYA
ncbi:MAG: DUF5011 domain-containing protein, partial [Clostridiales bacterium]|nr:DUF5011 domain-containing protein [Clostridiales bacterium]